MITVRLAVVTARPREWLVRSPPGDIDPDLDLVGWDERCRTAVDDLVLLLDSCGDTRERIGE